MNHLCLVEVRMRQLSSGHMLQKCCEEVYMYDINLIAEENRKEIQNDVVDN